MDDNSTVTYDGEFPVPRDWMRSHVGQTAQFTYRMSLIDLYECEGIEGMNDFLDAVLGNLILSDIGYEFAVDEKAPIDRDSVLIRATGTVEEF